MSGPSAGGKEHSTRARRLLLVLGATGLLLAAGLVAAVVTSMGARSMHRPRLATASLVVRCSGCVPCARTCPACPAKLARGAKALPGVVTARFTQHVSYGTGVVRYLPAAVHLPSVLARIERSPPYPGCCTGLRAKPRPTT